jgi:hypothetical protein
MDKALAQFISRIADRECEVDYQSEMASANSVIANQKQQMESSTLRRAEPSIMSDANSHIRGTDFSNLKMVTSTFKRYPQSTIKREANTSRVRESMVVIDYN